MNAPYEFSKEQQAYLQGLVMGSDVRAEDQTFRCSVVRPLRATVLQLSHITVGGGHLRASMQRLSNDLRLLGRARGRRESQTRQEWIGDVERNGDAIRSQ